MTEKTHRMKTCYHSNGEGEWAREKRRERVGWKGDSVAGWRVVLMVG